MSATSLRSLARPLVLGVLAVAVASGPSRGQSTSGVFDSAGMFSDEAIRRAKAEVARIEKAQGVAVAVETITTLKGSTIAEVAAERAQRLGHKGIFVLIAEREHKDEVIATPRAFLEEIGTVRLHEIRDAFTAEFKRGKLDEGLVAGVQAAGKVLATRAGQGSGRPVPSGGGFLPSATPEGSSAGGSSLVLRQQVRLTLLGARKAIEGAEAKAMKEGWKMNIAVVDDGGHLIAFARMDGARPASVATATTKAVSAATYRAATGPMAGTGPPGVTDVVLNVGVQNASGGKITTLLGGVPIVVDGQVIGAIGVGGGTGEQDAEAARAGLAGFLEGLQVKAEEPKLEAKPRDAEGTKPAGDDVKPQ